MAHGYGNRPRQKGYDGGIPSRNRLMLWLVLAVVLLIAGLLGIKALVDRIDPVQEETRGSLEGRFEPTMTLEHEGKTYAHQELDYTTILFIGVDKQVLGSSMLRGGGQADFLLLMTIDRKDREVEMLQIDRDTIAKVQVYGAFGNPAGSRETQLCLSYAFGTTPALGCQNTVRAVTDLLGGIPIDHYVALDMDGMSVLNDVLGGVTVTLEDDFSDIDPAMTAGATIQLHGQQAEYFLRGRMSVGDGTNQSRMNRQAAFMEAAAELLLDRMADSNAIVGEVLDALEEHMVASCEDGWLINQAYASRTFARTELKRLDGEHTVGSDGFVEFHPDRNGLMTYVIDTFCE